MQQVNIPLEYRDFPCDDYFGEGWSVDGYFDEAAQLWVIAPLAEAYLDREIGFFAVGRSGCDGIDFGYRKDQSGLWAFYPIECKFKYMASTVAELVDGWHSSRLFV